MACEPSPCASSESRKISKFLGLSWPGVAGDLGEVGVDAPLADLVADDRNLAGLDVLAVIGHRLGRPGIDARGEPAPQAWIRGSGVT